MTEHTAKRTTPKPSVSVEQQIKILDSHKVHFEYCSKDEAVRYLTKRTYFFKLKAFDNKFDKDEQGDYYNLDFAALQDISTIDYYIRQTSLHLTSDIEHSLKVRFNNLLMEQDTEDGYSIVTDFSAYEEEYHQENFHKSYNSQLRSTPYSKTIIDRYKGSYPAWLLWEFGTFDTTIRFYKFFLDQIGYKDTIYPLLSSVRLLRNASAHNNCLLTGTSEGISATRVLPPLLEELVPNQRNTKSIPLRNVLVHDFCCTLCCHINLVQSPDASERAHKDVEHLYKRISKHMDWYSQSHHCDELKNQLNAIVTLSKAFVSFQHHQEDNALLLEQPIRKKHRRARHKNSRIQ